MRFRWIALGVVGFAVWLIATFGVVYAAVELAETDAQTEAIVIGRDVFGRSGPNALVQYCVSYTVQGAAGEVCERHLRSVGVTSGCYLDAEIGKPLPDSCQ